MLPVMLLTTRKKFDVIVPPGAANDVIDLTRENVIAQRNSASDVVDITGSNLGV